MSLCRTPVSRDSVIALLVDKRIELALIAAGIDDFLCQLHVAATLYQSGLSLCLAYDNLD